MRLGLNVALGSFALSALSAQAADQKEPDPHAHHQVEAAGPAASQPSAEPTQSMMKAMQEMHQKMLAAKTPEERAALMQEHMKLMHEHMKMMQGCMARMGAGEKAARP